MNVETGQLFRNMPPDMLKQLIASNPDIVEVSEHVANLVEAGKEASTLELPNRAPVERARTSWHRRNTDTKNDVL